MGEMSPFLSLSAPRTRCHFSSAWRTHIFRCKHASSKYGSNHEVVRRVLLVFDHSYYRICFILPSRFASGRSAGRYATLIRSLEFLTEPSLWKRQPVARHTRHSPSFATKTGLGGKRLNKSLRTRIIEINHLIHF
jgi:hypothetical protein